MTSDTCMQRNACRMGAGTRIHRLWLAALLARCLQILLLVLLLHVPAAATPAARSYQDRVFASIDAMEQDLCTITSAAEQAAERYVAHPQGTLGVMGDNGFFREATDRSGGIMRLFGGTHATGEKGIILFCLSERDWEQDIRQAKYFAGTGSMIVVFGRQQLLDRAREAGCPMAAAIDLHVPGDGTWADGSISIDAPVKLAALWLWTGEFVAACTRRGKMPPMYLGYAVPGGTERAAKYGRHVRFHDKTPVAVPTGQVAHDYLAALRRDLAAVAEHETDEIVRTAELALEARKAGRGVYAFLHGHAVHCSLGGLADPGYFAQANSDWVELRDDIKLQPGDFMLCLGFDQPFDNEWFGNLAPRLRRDGVKLAISVTDYKHEAIGAIPPEEPFINQHWGFGDAVVELPGYDVKILPTSGVIAETILWMVQAEMHARAASPRAVRVDRSEPKDEAALVWRFDRDPTSQGWTTSAGWAPPQGDEPGFVHVRHGEWVRNDVPVAPGAVYMARVTCRADGPGYWQWDFRDAAGGMLFGPVSPITASEDWQLLSTQVPVHPHATTGVLRIWPEKRDSVRVRELRIEPVTDDAALAWYDAFYAKLTELGPCRQPEPGRLIPETIRRLRDGGRIMIVLLGDSFTNDLFYGGFGLLLRRAFPEANIDVIPVVGNAAGAYYWRAENRLADLVLPMEPDLVVYTGVSTSVYSMDNVADLVRQLRDAGIDEILLTHDAPGNAMEPKHAGKRGWSSQIGPESKDYAGRLYNYALEAEVELADVAGPLLQAIIDSGEDPESYMRDIIHYNDRGRHLMARALVNYFVAACAAANEP